MPEREIKTLSEWVEKRENLVKWAEDPMNLVDAHLKQPFHKANEPPLQMKFINALRKHYTKYAPAVGSEEIHMKLQSCKTFGLKDCSEKIVMPVFRKGEYDAQATCVVDFANKVFGGGFLSHGFAQEERLILSYLDIAWMIAQKYAVGNMFAIGEDEAIIIEGAAHWSHIEFYGKVPENWLSHSMLCEAKGSSYHNRVRLPTSFL